MKIDEMLAQQIISDTCNYHREYPWDALKPLSEEFIEFLQNLSEEEQTIFNIEAKNIDDDLSIKFLTDPKIASETKSNYLNLFPSFQVNNAIKDVFEAIKKNYEQEKKVYI